MNLLVLLAVAVVFGLLRFRRAALLVWAARLVGRDLRGPAIRLLDADSRLRRITIYMGIVSLGLLAYVTSSPDRRAEIAGPLVRFATEKRYTALLGATVVALPALAAASVYARMNVPLEPPFFARTVHPASPPEITVNGKTIAIDAGDNPFRALERVEPGRVPHPRRERPPHLLPELLLLSRRRSGRQRDVRARLEPHPDQLHRRGHDRRTCSETFLFWRIAKGGPGHARGRRAVATGAMPAWEKILKQRGDVGSRPLPLRLHRRTAPRQGGGDAPMTARLIWGGSVLVAAVAWATAVGSLRAQGPDVGTEAQRAAGKELYARNCAQCHGDKGDGDGVAAAHLDAAAARLHLRQVQGPHDAERRAADASRISSHIIKRGMPYTSMPAWPALSDAQVSEPRLLRQDVLARLRQARQRPQGGRAAERAEHVERHRGAGEEALRRDRLRPVSRRARARRRTIGAHPQGRLGSPDPRRRSDAAVDLPRRAVARGHLPDDDHGLQRHADAGLRRRAHGRAALGDHRLHRLAVRRPSAELLERSSSPRRPRRRSICRRAPRTSPPRRRPAFRSSARSCSPDGRSPAGDVRDGPGDLQRHDRSRCWCAGTIGAPRRPARTGRRCRCRSKRKNRRRPSATDRRQCRFGRRRSRSPGRGRATDPRDPFARGGAAPAAASEFSDAVAIQMPVEAPTAPASRTSSSASKEYPVDLWFVDLATADAGSVQGQGQRRHRRRPTPPASPAWPATTRANGRSSSSAPVAPTPAPPSRPASSCRSRSRSGTASRVSAATSAGSRRGARSTSSPSTCRRRRRR